MTRRPARILPVIVLSQLAGTSLWFAGNAVLPDLQNRLGLPDQALGHVTAAVQLGFIAGTLAFAVLAVSDRYSPRATFLACSLLGAACNAGLYFWSGEIALLLTRFATGFFLAGVYPIGMKIASGWYRSDLGKALGFLVGACVLGTALPHLIRGLGQTLPWETVILSVSLIAALGGVVMYVLVPDGPFLVAGSSFDPRALLAVFRSAGFRASAFGYFGHMWELYAFWAFLPPALAAYASRPEPVDLNLSLLSFAVIAAGAMGCVVGGYLSVSLGSARVAFAQLVLNDHEAAYAAAAEAAAIGERCGDLELTACARMEQGRIRLQQGQVEAGLTHLDETMVAVISGELSPLVTGLMYCSVIQACQQVYAFDRTREWTVALTQWCEGQPDMVAFAGACQVHRAEIMQLLGTWPEAIEAAQNACARSQGVDRRAAAAALYQQAEVYRLRGEFVAAGEAYRGASQLGREPQPGLALLRLAQERTNAAATAIRRVAGTTTDRLRRMSLLPAYIDIMLAAGDIPEARNACRELEEIARCLDTGVPGAIAAEARGAVDLAEGHAQAALGPLRRAFEVWQRIEAPYAAARVRVLIGLACHALGDEDGARLEIDSAKSTFERLGAAPDLARIDSLIADAPSGHAHGLTPRELQVLRLVAAGHTNKAIAAELCLSDRTVERHLSNIFTKLDLSTRAAATAWVYEHDLI